MPLVRHAVLVLAAVPLLVVRDATRADEPVPMGPLLPFSTVLGGSGADVAEAAAFGPDGALWIVATSYSPDLSGAAYPGNRDGDVVVLRFDPVTHAVLSSAWIGSSGYDSAAGLVFGPGGEAFVVGNSSYDYDLDIPGAKAFGTPGPSHCFVARVAADGTAFDWIATLDGRIRSLAMSPDGDPIVCGDSTSAAFPLQSPIRSVRADAFLTRIASDGSALVFSTFLGGSGAEGATYASALAVEADGSILVAGGTTPNGFDDPDRLVGEPTQGGVEGFLAEVDAQGTVVRRAVLFGDTYFASLLAAPEGVLLLGGTHEAGFPAPPQPHGPPGNDRDAFLIRLDAADWSILAAALLGGSGDEYYLSVAAAPDGTLWVGGSTTSEDLPVPGAVQPLMGSNEDAFVAAFAADDLALRYATYLGGDQRELGQSVVADADGSVWLLGATWSGNYPLAGPIQQLPPPDSPYEMLVAHLVRGDPASAPTAPTGLTAEVADAHSVHLRWQSASSNQTGFAVYRRSIGFERVATVDAAATEWVDDDLVALRNYTYAVQAVNDAGGSPPVVSETLQMPATLDVAVSWGRARYIPDWFDGTSVLELQGTIAPTDGSGATLDPQRDGIAWDVLSVYFGVTFTLSIPPDDAHWRKVRHGLRWKARGGRFDFDPATGRFALRVRSYGWAVVPDAPDWSVRATVGNDAGAVSPEWRPVDRFRLRTP